MLTKKEQKEVKELKEKIYWLEHDEDRVGTFNPRLVSLYRRMQELYRKQEGEVKNGTKR